MIPIAVFASGRGSGFDALLAACNSGLLKAEIKALVCDRPDAPVIGKARAAEIPVLVVPVPEGVSNLQESRALHDSRILEALRPHRPHFAVMSGYMRVITKTLLGAFQSERGYSRITNVHPSLLPSFPGVKAYRQAWNHGVCFTGVTVHLVENEIDRGPICAQEAFSIGDCRSAEDVERKGLKIEHQLYPEALRWILSERFDVENREGRTCVRPH